MEYKAVKLPSTRIPEASLKRDDVAREMPGLLTLYDEFPHIIYTKSDPVYESISSAFNKSTSTLPLAVIRPLDETHVQATIKAVKAAGLPLGIRSGGSEMSGRNFRGVDTGVILDLRSLCSVNISEDKTSAVIGGGIIAGDLAVALQDQGAFTPIGWHPRLGYAGWSMAGGYGLYASSYGLGVDHILGARLVIADGSAIVVDENHHSDLLWALRGAGNGIWGVVTQFIIKIYPAPKLLVGSLQVDKQHWPSLFAEWINNIEPNLPDEIAGDLYFRNIVLDKPEMLICFGWCAKQGDDLQKGWDYFDKMKSLPGAVVVRIAESDFASYILSEMTIQPEAFQVRGVMAKGLTKSIGSVLIRQWENPKTFMGIPSHFAHGMAIKPNPGACFPLRYRHRLFPVFSRHAGLLRTEESELYEWNAISQTVEEIKATGDAYVGASYQNLIPSRDTDLEVTFGKDTLDKLRGLKKKYDPDNFFSRGYPVL
ncbi:hypothetical protein ACHAQJ_007602 [Trichoderma viride]